MRKNRLFQILYPIAVYYLLYHLLYLSLRFLFDGVVSHERFPDLAWLGIASMITIPVMYGIYKKLPIVRESNKLQWEKLPKELLGILLVIAAGILYNFILTNTPLIGLSEGYVQANRTLYDGSVMVKLLVNGMAIPVLEELVYRGIVLGQLRLWYAEGTAVVISSFLFGLMHFNIVQFAYGFLVGCIIGHVYIRTSRLWVVMAAHGLTNAIVILMTLGR